MENLILYSYYRSSASYRVRIGLHFKNIAFEYRPLHLVKEGGMQLKSEFKSLNPMAQVPLLVHGNFKLSQSMAILFYLDENFKGPKLIPSNPQIRAKALELSEIINSGIQPLQNLSVSNEIGKRFNQPKEAQLEWNKHWIHKGLTAVETLLKFQKSKFCLGDQISLVDCFLIPQVYSAKRFGVELIDFPNILEVYNNTQELEAFQKAAPEAQIDFEAN